MRDAVILEAVRTPIGKGHPEKGYYAGIHDVAIGGGVEHMGRIPMFVGRKWADEIGTPYPPELLERYALVDQGFSAELIAERWDISRTALDEFALRSHRRAADAREQG